LIVIDSTLCLINTWKKKDNKIKINHKKVQVLELEVESFTFIEQEDGGNNKEKK